MNKLRVSSSPHIRSEASTQRIMLDVVIALLPTTVAGAVIFGIRALAVILACVLSAVLAEFVFDLIVKKEQTVTDLSAVVTGLLLGLNLHAEAPIWQCVIGSVFAIIVVKCLFGGLGCNFANPAVAGRVFLLICFTGTLSGGAIPAIGREAGAELVTGATPLASLGAISGGGAAELPSLLDMFLGVYPGAIGEVCSAALIIGFAYLVIRRVINFEVPVIFVATVFLMFLIFTNDVTLALYQVLSGGLLIGAIFMATDYVTTPITRSGRMIFAFGAGLITALIRFFGNYPEGVSFAILFMNVISPYIEKWTRTKPLGGTK